MATLFDSASLVMIPSGVKEDKLYSIKPTDGSGDFTFSRGSDIQATRVNASGLIEKAKVNLLLQSNNFGTTWTSVNSGSVTSGQTGYDGSSDAWLLTKAATNFSGIRQSVSVSGVHTFSIIAKAGSLNYLWVEEYIGASIYFDLVNGTTSGSGAISSSMTSLGGGWWRCELASSVSITIATLYPQAGSSPSATAGNILIQDAALCHGLIAQDYVETTTTAVVEGLTADLPRLDYSGGASCPSLLLEPSRTNLFEYSEYFGATYWEKTNATITDNATTSPEGVGNASAFTENTSTSTHFIKSDQISASASTYYSASYFVKYNGRHFQILGSTGSEGGGYVNFDLINGEVGDSDQITGSIESLGDGWYKCTGTNISQSSATEIRLLPYLCTSPTSSRGESYTGDGTSGVYLFGAQLEAGSYPTSYIPTYGTAAVRGEDFNYLLSISDILNNSEGTLFLEVQGLFNGGDSRRFTISDGTTSNRVAIELDEIASRIRSYVVGGGANDGNLDIDGVDQTGNLKIGVTYDGSALKMSVNGSTPSSLATSVVLSGMNRMQFSTAGASTNKMFGKVKQTLVFKTALTNAELAALTAL